MKEFLTAIASIMTVILIWVLFVYIVIQPVPAAELPELKKCNLHKVQKPIQSSTGNIFVLKDGKWQLLVIK